MPDGLITYDEHTVLAEEIDSLGHMNVRYYLAAVDRANLRLRREIGLLGDKEGGLRVRRFDTYSRFRQEQFTGANLATVGGVIGADSEQVRAYFEIRNVDNDQIAASFITGSCLVDPDTQQRGELPEPVLSAAYAACIELPAYAVPRTIKLDPPRTDVCYDAISAKIADDPVPGMMSGRRENVVYAEDCNEAGWLREDVDMMFVMHRPPPGESQAMMGPPVQRTAEGHRYSWAMMETRSVTLGKPRVDTRIASLGADIAIAGKARHSRRWMFDLDSKTLLSINDSVGVCLDLDARKVIDIPEDVRADMARNYLPEFA